MRTAFHSAVLLAAIVWTPALSAQKPRSLQDDFLARETAVWENVKNKRMDALQGAFTDGYAGIYDAGIVDRAGEMNNIKQTTVNSYRIDNFRARPIDAQNVLLTYTAPLDVTMNGTHATGTYHVMSVWHRTNGRWQTATHTEVKAQ
jgi:hypothetical protein